MNAKWRYILGTVTIVSIVGGTIYAIKKSKEVEKAEENAISIDEAREIVKQSKTEEALESSDVVVDVVIKEDELSEEEITTQQTTAALEGHIPDRKIEVLSKRDYDALLDEEQDEHPDVDERIEGPKFTVEPLRDFMYVEEGIDPKEDKTLRYHPDSVEAKHQFIRMELAEWEPMSDVYRILLQLFEVPFIPNSDGDEMLGTKVIDYKVHFYGFNSRWNKEVSYGDIVMHYARLAEFNCGETVAYWTEHFLYSAGFEWDMSEQQIDTLVMRLNSHSHRNPKRDTFGLFGIASEYMDEAIKIANRNADRSVTYDIEFNEFLKSCMNGDLQQ